MLLRQNSNSGPQQDKHDSERPDQPGFALVKIGKERQEQRRSEKNTPVTIDPAWNWHFFILA
jgi:hypothetical protein